MHKRPSLNKLLFPSSDIKIFSGNKIWIKFCGEDPRRNSELKDQVQPTVAVSFQLLLEILAILLLTSVMKIRK